MKKLILIFAAILGLNLAAQAQTANDTVNKKETYDEMLARIRLFSMGGAKLNFRASGKMGNRAYDWLLCLFASLVVNAVNLFWEIHPDLKIGMEYLFGMKELQYYGSEPVDKSSLYGVANRLDFMLNYSF